jgi:hypothetical protein
MLTKKADPETAASSSTPDQTLAVKLHRRDRALLPRAVIVKSISETRNQAIWKVRNTLKGHSGILAVRQVDRVSGQRRDGQALALGHGGGPRHARGAQV